MFSSARKIQQAKDEAKAEFEKALASKDDSKKERAFRVKIGLRIRSSIDQTFVEGAEKFAKYAELSLAAIAAGEEKPVPPKSTCFVKIKSLNGEIFSYLPEDNAEAIFQLGGKYQNMEIDAKTATRRAQVIANQYAYDLDLDNSLTVLKFLRDELEEAGEPFLDTDEDEPETDKP